jgi:hypothetical protein
VYLASLVDGTPQTMNVPHYAGIVKAHAARRALLAEADRIKAGALAGDDPDATIAEALIGLIAFGTGWARPVQTPRLSSSPRPAPRVRRRRRRP